MPWVDKPPQPCGLKGRETLDPELSRVGGRTAESERIPQTAEAFAQEVGRGLYRNYAIIIWELYGRASG